MQKATELLNKSATLQQNNVQFERQKHPFHILRPSKYPFFVSIFVFMWLVPQTLYMHGIDLPFGLRPDILHLGFVGLFGVAMSWFFKILKESAEGYHTKKVQLGLRTGMLLFILSEVMFFFAFFWGFFHYTLIPSAAIGAIWPPLGTQPLDVWGLPLVNTMLLLTSGVTITIAHAFLINDHYVIAPKWAKSLKYRSIKEMINAGVDLKRAVYAGVVCKSRNHDGFQWFLLLTVVLGVAFLLCQAYEYKHGVKFSWRENIYGSIFFVTTGFHGLHVTIGTLFLAYNLVRSYASTVVADAKFSGLATQEKAWLSHMGFERNHHFGFEAAAWYWHFVDVVWLFLFVTVYWWGGR